MVINAVDAGAKILDCQFFILQGKPPGGECLKKLKWGNNLKQRRKKCNLFECFQFYEEPFEVRFS
jgi:hypothetical protein